MSKKLLGAVLAGGLVVGTVVVAKGASQARLAMTPEGRTCAKLAELCPRDAKHAASLESCVQDLEDLRKVAGAPALERSMACIEESRSCTAAAGCLAGGAGVGVLGEMMKGFGSALSR